MRNKFVIALFGILIFATISADAKEQEGRPNILVILVDDMGWSDIGSYGSEIATPNIDRLAYNGLRFTQFYNAGRCSATRASLLTGLYPHQTGIGWHTNHSQSLNYDFGIHSYRGFLNRNSATLAEVLGKAGYDTYMSGKWHLGYHTPDRWPMQRGFDRFYGIIGGASSYFKPSKSSGLMLNNTIQPTPDPSRYYTTDAFTDYAIKFIEEHEADNPFFLYLAYTAPHWPLHAKKQDIARYVGRYRDVGWDKLREQRLARMIELGVLPKGYQLSARDPEARAWDKLTSEQKEDLDYRMAVYAAMMHSVDENIGKLVASLKKKGELDNTILIFLSDNGGCAEPYNDLGGRDSKFINDPDFSSNVSYGTGWANASNTPFRQFKSWVNEGGIATPLIVHWPAGINKKLAGSLIRTPSHLIDLAPTFYEAAGADYPNTFNRYPIPPLEGKSLLKAIQTGKHKPQQWLFWEHEGNRAVRNGDWKAVWETGLPPKRSAEGVRWQLFDIASDRNEENDLAAKERKRLAKMALKWDQWAERIGVLPARPTMSSSEDRIWAPAVTWPMIAGDKK